MPRDIPDEWAAAMIAAGCVDPRRKAAVASMTQLAHQSGLAVETVRRMVHGLGVSEPVNIQAVADVLGDAVFDLVERTRSNAQPWTAPPEAAYLSDDEGETLTRLIRQMTAHRRAPGQRRSTLAVLPKMEDPEDYDQVAALFEREPAGPHDEDST